MGPVFTVLTAGLLCLLAVLVAVSDRSLSAAGVLTLVLPAFAFVYALLTLYRVCSAAR